MPKVCARKYSAGPRRKENKTSSKEIYLDTDKDNGNDIKNQQKEYQIQTTS